MIKHIKRFFGLTTETTATPAVEAPVTTSAPTEVVKAVKKPALKKATTKPKADKPATAKKKATAKK